MIQHLRIAFLIGFALCLSGCAGVRTRVVTPASGIGGVKQVVLRRVDIQSTALSQEAIGLNQQLKASTVGELKSLLATKGIAVLREAPWEIKCKIVITDAGRAAFSFAGLGGGRIFVSIELRDRDGVRYATTSESALNPGMFGADAASLARATIHEAISQFGSRL